MELYQLAVLIISTAMIYQGIDKLRKGVSGQTVLKFTARLVIWVGIAAIALFPRLTNYLAEFIGIEGNINAVILIGFILVFLIIFKLLSAIERLEQQLSEVTRNEALKEIKSLREKK